VRGFAVVITMMRPALELDSVQAVLLELLCHAAAGKSAMAGAAGDVALVFGEEAPEILALDLANQVLGEIRQSAIDVDEGTALLPARETGGD
jgi:hypothetical protein